MKTQDVRPGVQVLTRQHQLYTVRAVREARPGVLYVTVQPAGGRYEYCVEMTEKTLAEWDVYQPVDREHV